MKTVKLDIRLSVEEKEALYARAKGVGLSVSEYVRNWINHEENHKIMSVAFDGPLSKQEVLKSVSLEDAARAVKAKGAIAKAKKIESSFKPMFKDSKLNKI
jgi:hypothetical protein